MYNQVFSNELYHHGVKGQKWGVRRYQNEDGTLTEAGKKRYHVEYDRWGDTRIVDEQGKRMKGRDRRYMEKQMKKTLRTEDNEKYGQYMKAKKDANTSATYIGQSETMALATMAYNSATRSQREKGKETVDRMVAEYANSYLNDLSKNKPDKLQIPDGVSSVTKKAIENYNSMDDKEFKSKFHVSKKEYRKRVEKYGDPYMNSPYAKYAKRKNKKVAARYDKKINAVQRDIDSFKGHEKGIYADNGKMLLSEQDVSSSVNALQERKKKLEDRKRRALR